jgi:hypothetical protein
MPQQLQNVVNNPALQSNAQYSKDGVDLSNKLYEKYNSKLFYDIPSDPRKPFATGNVSRGVEPINSSGERHHEVRKANWDTESVWQEQKKLKLAKNYGYVGSGAYIDDNFDVDALLKWYRSH